MDENVVILIRSPVCHLRNEFSRVVSNLIMFTSNESYLPFDLTRFRFFRIFLLFWHSTIEHFIDGVDRLPYGAAIRKQIAVGDYVTWYAYTTRWNFAV